MNIKEIKKLEIKIGRGCCVILNIFMWLIHTYLLFDYDLFIKILAICMLGFWTYMGLWLLRWFKKDRYYKKISNRKWGKA